LVRARSFIGDVFGTPGMRVAQRYLAAHAADVRPRGGQRRERRGRLRLTRKHAEQLWTWGVDVITLGNHTWDQAEVVEAARVLDPHRAPGELPARHAGPRPHHGPAGSGERLTVGPGDGAGVHGAARRPVRGGRRDRRRVPAGQALLIDVHAEATSEKKVLGYHLQGRASAVIGTHTHVQTADEGVHAGTAYITDVGMSGVQHSSIGMQFDEVHARFTTRRPHRFRPAAGPATLCGVVLDLDGRRTRDIHRFQWGESAASDGVEP
jgi:calcineurin-like phosphoesterase